jgi:hypothetical protein
MTAAPGCDAVTPSSPRTARSTLEGAAPRGSIEVRTPVVVER